MPAPIDNRVIETAINLEWLTEEESHDRQKVGELIAQIAFEWAKRWENELRGTRPAA